MVNLRSQQPIGAILSAVKEEEELYDEIYESWIHDRHVRFWPCAGNSWALVESAACLMYLLLALCCDA